MARLLRTFAAVRCSAPITRALCRWGERLSGIDGALRVPETDDFHLTLQFLGGTAEEDVRDIGRALEDAVGEMEPFEIQVRGLGAFPNAERARVVWAGVEEVEPAGRLQALQAAVADALGGVGYPPESRAWHPHVTLGRVRRRPGPALVEAIEGAAAADLGSEWVSELKLILSDPGNRGYRYIDLTTVELGGEDG